MRSLHAPAGQARPLTLAGLLPRSRACAGLPLPPLPAPPWVACMALGSAVVLEGDAGAGDVRPGVLPVWASSCALRLVVVRGGDADSAAAAASLLCRLPNARRRDSARSTRAAVAAAAEGLMGAGAAGVAADESPTRQRTRSARRSADSVRGWKTTSSLTSWPGACGIERYLAAERARGAHCRVCVDKCAACVARPRKDGACADACVDAQPMLHAQGARVQGACAPACMAPPDASVHPSLPLLSSLCTRPPFLVVSTFAQSAWVKVSFSFFNPPLPEIPPPSCWSKGGRSNSAPDPPPLVLSPFPSYTHSGRQKNAGQAPPPLPPPGAPPSLTRKPVAGLMLKCSPSAALSHSNLVPRSPVFSSVRRLSAREPSTTGPNGTESDARRSSVPAHAPDSRSSGSVTPAAEGGEGGTSIRGQAEVIGGTSAGPPCSTLHGRAAEGRMQHGSRVHSVRAPTGLKPQGAWRLCSTAHRPLRTHAPYISCTHTRSHARIHTHAHASARTSRIDGHLLVEGLAPRRGAVRKLDLHHLTRPEHQTLLGQGHLQARAGIPSACTRVNACAFVCVVCCAKSCVCVLYAVPSCAFVCCMLCRVAYVRACMPQTVCAGCACAACV